MVSSYGSDYLSPDRGIVCHAEALANTKVLEEVTLQISFGSGLKF